MGRAAGVATSIIAIARRLKLRRSLARVTDFEAEAIERLRSKKLPKKTSKKSVEMEPELEPDRLIAIPRMHRLHLMRIPPLRRLSECWICIHPVTHRAIAEAAAASGRYRLHLQEEELRGSHKWLDWISVIATGLAFTYLMEYTGKLIGVFSHKSVYDGVLHIGHQYCSIYEFDTARADKDCDDLTAKLHETTITILTQISSLPLSLHLWRLSFLDGSRLPYSDVSAPRLLGDIFPTPSSLYARQSLYGRPSPCGQIRAYIRADDLQLARFRTFSGWPA